VQDREEKSVIAIDSASFAWEANPEKRKSKKVKNDKEAKEQEAAKVQEASREKEDSEKPVKEAGKEVIIFIIFLQLHKRN
jgi:hypothetical protein